MAYLKCHYKTIFFANLLTNSIGSETKTNEYIMEAKANKIKIEKPSINNSTSKYLVKDDTIIYPISNSSWVSPAQCVPKKGGMIVIANEANKLLPTRMVTGWRICEKR